ncbi:MAG TPA: glycosyltransferase [Vicinamibacteria bacterium]
MSAPRIVYVLSKVPCYDEAFLLREIAEVSRRLDCYIFSLRPPDEKIVHEEAHALVPRTLYVPFFFSWAVWRAQLASMLSSPLRYFHALFGLVRAHLGSPAFLLKSLAFFPKAVWLGRFAAQNGITHLHGGWATYPATVATVAADLCALPMSFSGHAHDLYVDGTGLRQKLARASFVTTCTESNALFLKGIARDGDAAKVKVVRHGVRLLEYTPAPRGERPLEILSVGTLNPHKGFAVLIDALARLALGGLDFRCTIVGGGPLDTELRARAKAAGLDDSRLVFTGALTQAQVGPHYARASVFVLLAQPEWHWGVPNVIVEALAARNAVVTTRFGSVEELVRDGETGLIVPPRDTEAVANTLGQLAREPALRERLAAAGHEQVAREFDLARCASTYLDLFGGARA